MMAFVKIITYYAPIAFFALFADLVATYGSSVASAYGRAMVVYYPLCFIYIFTAFPLFAYIGGGRHGIKTMFQHIARPAIMSLGTCSSSATIPTNLREAEDTGIPKDVADMVVPMGATMHMDGSCFSCVLKIAFVLGAMGVDMPWTMLRRWWLWRCSPRWACPACPAEATSVSTSSAPSSSPSRLRLPSPSWWPSATW